MHRRPAHERRPAAEPVLALVLWVAAADVGRVRDVDGDRDRRLERVGGGPRAGEVADLLLHDREAGDIARRAARSATRRATSSATYQPSLLSSAREAMRPFRQLDRRAGDAPQRRRPGRSARLVSVFAPMSMKQVVEARAACGRRLAAASACARRRRPAPARPSSRSRRAGRRARCGSKPPSRGLRAGRRSPTCVTTRPISSMCPTIASSGPPPVPGRAPTTSRARRPRPRRTRAPPRATPSAAGSS